MRDEVMGLTWADDTAARRVSDGIEHFENNGWSSWAAAIVAMADVHGHFEVDETGVGPHEAVTGVPSSLGHARDVSLGFTAPVNPPRRIGYEVDGEYESDHLTRLWLEAAHVHLLRPVAS